MTVATLEQIVEGIIEYAKKQKGKGWKEIVKQSKTENLGDYLADFYPESISTVQEGIDFMADQVESYDSNI